MLRVATASLKPGMELALPVMHPEQPAQVLLKTGYALTDGAITKLRELRVTQAWVQYPGLAFLEKYVSPEVCNAQNDVFCQVADTIETLQREATPKLDYPAYVDAVGTLISEVMTHPTAAVFVGDLFEADNDLLRHASSVTYLSLLMGLKLDNYLVRQRKHVRPDRAKDVTNLGLGAMLHDVGVPRLPQEVRDAYFKHGNDKDPEWREHPAIGFRLVRGAVDPTAAAVVLHHHQRADGKGYAGADFSVLSGESIHVYARIVAVADQFDRLRRPPGLPPQPAVFALRAFQVPRVAQQFDPEVLDALYKVVPAFPPGSRLQLSDGRAGVVVEPHPEQPCRPTLQLLATLAALDNPDIKPEGETIDLRDVSTDVFVQRCDGQDVGAFNFLLPETDQRVAA